MDFIIVKRDTSEWHFMWLWLELHEINVGLIEPTVAEHQGEVWEYMGSYRNKDNTVHEFRHRLHPSNNILTIKSLSASDSFTEDQIESIRKIV